MRDLARKHAALAVAAALSVAWGCSGAPHAESSNSKVAVSGTVRYNGKPAEGGTLTFDPANVNRKTAPVAKAAVGPDGSYKVETLYGGNMVQYTPKKPKPGELNQIPVDVQGGTQDLEFKWP